MLITPLFLPENIKLGQEFFLVWYQSHQMIQNHKIIEMHGTTLSPGKKPFLTLFSNRDPITRGGEKYFQRSIPGCKNQNHQIIKNAGHFVQEEKSNELSEAITDFIRHTD